MKGGWVSPCHILTFHTCFSPTHFIPSTHWNYFTYMPLVFSPLFCVLCVKSSLLSISVKYYCSRIGPSGLRALSRNKVSPINGFSFSFFISFFPTLTFLLEGVIVGSRNFAWCLKSQNKEIRVKHKTCLESPEMVRKIDHIFDNPLSDTKHFRWCRWGTKQGVERAQTWERGPPSAPAEISLVISLFTSCLVLCTPNCTTGALWCYADS
jgi:hypothetical protein